MPSRKKVLLLVGVGVSFFLGAAGVSLAAAGYAYRDRYYPGVKVVGIDLAGKTRTEGQKLVDEKVKQYLAHSFKVVLPDASKPIADSPNQYEDLEISATAEHLGLAFEGVTAEKRAWAIGHTYTANTWFQQVVPAFFNGAVQPLPFTVNKQAIQTFIDTEVVPKIGLPIPAKISVNDTTVAVEPQRPGFAIEQETFSKALVKSLETVTDGDATYLKAPVKMTESSVTTQSLQPIADRLDAIGNLKVTLKADTYSKNLTRKQLLSWYTPVQDEKGVVTLTAQKEVVNQFLASQSELDARKSIDPLMQKVAEWVDKPTNMTVAVTAKPPKVSPNDANFTPNKFEGKYVEVNLATQRLYLVQGGTLDKSYVVSTGKWSTATPLGTFYIHGKITRAYSAAYGLYMPYWQNFLGGEYGLHELPEWPNGYKEGQNHLGTPVSHGCVRLGVGDAKEVYNWTEDGTPVYIH